MLILSFFITCPTKMVIKSGFEGFFRVKKSPGKTYDDFIPEKWGFGVNFRLKNFRLNLDRVLKTIFLE